MHSLRPPACASHLRPAALSRAICAGLLLLLMLLLGLCASAAWADVEIPGLPEDSAEQPPEPDPGNAQDESAPAEEANPEPAPASRPQAEAGSAGIGSDVLAQARALVFGNSDPRAALSSHSLSEVPPRYKLARAAELLSGGSDAAALSLQALINWLQPLKGRSAAERDTVSLEQLTRAAALSPAEAEAWLYSAWILAAGGRVEAARAQLRSGLAQTERPELLVALLALLGSAGLEAQPLGLQPALPAQQLSDEAADELQQLWQNLLERWPQSTSTLIADAQRVAAQSGGNAARQALERALASEPPPLPAEEAYIYRRLGQLFDEAGQVKQAEDAYRQSLALQYDPRLVRMLADAGRREDAQRGDMVWQQYLRTYGDDPRIWVAYGRYLEDQGDLEHALRQYESSYYLAPEFGPGYSAAGACLLKLGRQDEGQRLLSRSLSLEPQLDSYLLLARLQLDGGQDIQAEQTLRQALQDFPEQLQLLQLHASALARLGRGGEALELLAGHLDSLGAAEPSLYLILAQSAEAGGDANLALSFYERGLQFHPADYALRRNHALGLARQGRGEALLSAVLSARPQLSQRDFAALVDALALYWIEKADFGAGTAFMNQLITALPADPTAYSELALMQSAQGFFNEALASVQRGLNDAGDNYLGRYLEAYLVFRINGPQDALPLARALPEHPQVDANGYVLYLRLLEERGDYLEQADVARRGLELFPGHKDLFAFLARSLYFSGDTPAVISLLEDPAQAQISYPAREEMLGSAYLDEGSPVKAAALLKTALAARPGNASLLALQAQAHYALGQYPEARSLCQEALRSNPDSTAAQLWLGFALEALGELEAAASALAFVSKSPLASREELAWAALGHARLALDVGDSAEAATRLGEAEAFEYYAPFFQAELDRSRSSAGL
ncbi:tetratricopeptide repeat protein [bacterium]|nr:tetratricopeptide repeat protein [bacterium]